ncbi:MAG: hypothetical protein KA603_01275 [Azonexus sp.]|jgi:hypothetical protein|nr:hypothetical protein [Betaproteobacteria bacterium]MBK8918818.1 hypothetical protein [Betaproteobacteria bacterium]MBP6034750.1 hypothetical protein [Azonexus sp.]MBP6905290.1 hypothetical protein [Azonexus sp.]
MSLKLGHVLGLSLAFALAGPVAGAADPAAPIPVAVAESEAFEVVGRLEDEGFVFYIDRADSNAPVLGATLEVDTGGKAAKASFRAERGDYLIADADWLKPLRQPGEYALAMTLVAGAESDLLTADFDVHAPSAAAAGTAGSGRILGGLALLAGLIALLLWRRGRKGGRA